MKKSNDSSNSEPIKYKIAGGVKRINGKKIGRTKFVTLSKQEAMYDLALGRLIELDNDKVPNDTETDAEEVS